MTTTTTTTTPKGKLKSITIERAEGPSALCGQPRTVTSFSQADAILQSWATTAPKGGGYDKCDFTVEWDNGDSYIGRFDLVRDDQARGRLLQSQMIDCLRFYAGLRRPAHLTEERYRAFLRLRRLEESTRDAARFLAAVDWE